MREKLGSWNLNIGDVRQIKHRIIETFDKLLLLASTVAFAAMAVSSLGVTNTIMASIRSRRWQFGVLRSIGVTRGTLARLILAEGILLGAIGCALGLTAGMIMSINAKQLAVVVLGYNPPMVIPWLIIGIGTAIVFAVTLIASILPARGVANTEILELLQAGRAAA
jgi:putative ABC transport system permease protein